MTFLLTIAIYLVKTEIVLLVAKKMQIAFKYLYFLDIFLEKKVLILLDSTKLNQYVIEF